MRLPTVLFSVLSAIVTAQAGDTGNNPIVPLPATVQAGQAIPLSWTPNTGGTVTLQLRSGSIGNLDLVSTIAATIPNTGTYTWTPDPNLKAGTDHTIEIISDADTTKTNYSPMFAILSNGTGYATTTTAASTTTTTTSTPSQTAGTTSAKSESSSFNSTITTHVSTATATKTASSTKHAVTNGAVKVGSGLARLMGVGAMVAGAL